MAQTNPGKWRRTALVVPVFIALLLLALSSLQSSQPKGPAWVREGIVATSDMEALTFILRSGGAPVNAVEQWNWQRSEEAVRKLKAAGVNFAISNFHKGAGLAAEHRDIEASRAFVTLAHKAGIRVAGYVGATMMYETLFQEAPEARDWRQQNEFGEPIYYTPDQTFRYMACRNNPGYRAFIRKVVRMGIQDLKFDAIHFDQMQWWQEPNSCRCQFCRAQFREFLQKRYPDPQRARLRFGFTKFDEVIPPPYGLHEPPVRLAELHNPMMQEWAEFRAWSLARDFQEFAGYVHEANPDAAIIGNPTMNLESNVGFMDGVSPQELFPTADGIWTEEPNLPEWTPDERLVSMIRSYKAARSMGKPLFHWQNLMRADAYRKAPIVLRLAESIAYDDANLGVVAGGSVGWNDLPAVVQPYVTFFRSNLSDLVHTNEVADAAILRSFPSVEFNPSVSLFNTVLFEQTLIQTKIPFGLIFDRQLADLAKYKVLVLADQDALSDEQLARIRAFVEQGGGLVATGATSLLTDWRTKRGRFGLADLFGTTAPPAETAANAPIERQFGKGRVVYIPRIEAEVPAPPAQMNYTVRNAAWKLPKNYQQLTAAVRWAAGGELSAEVDAPLWVTAELAEQPGTRTRLLHLVNFKYREPLKDIPVRLRIPAGMRVREVILKSPGEGSPERLKFSADAGIASLRVPQLNVYDLVMFRMEAQ
jgi:Beta-galactosidase